jgi:hypothetical protein
LPFSLPKRENKSLGAGGRINERNMSEGEGSIVLRRKRDILKTRNEREESFARNFSWL